MKRAPRVSNGPNHLGFSRRVQVRDRGVPFSFVAARYAELAAAGQTTLVRRDTRFQLLRS